MIVVRVVLIVLLAALIHVFARIRRSFRYLESQNERLRDKLTDVYGDDLDPVSRVVDVIDTNQRRIRRSVRNGYVFTVLCAVGIGYNVGSLIAGTR